MEHGLTDRELECIWAVAEYGGQVPAAQEIGMAVQTLKNHISDIIRKTDSVSALQAYHRLIGGKRLRATVVTQITYEEERS